MPESKDDNLTVKTNYFKVGRFKAYTFQYRERSLSYDDKR